MGEVVDIFSRSRVRSSVKTEENQSEAVVVNGNVPAANTDFSEIARRNFENQERLRKERAQANQSVLKSYKIKS